MMNDYLIFLSLMSGKMVLSMAEGGEKECTPELMPFHIEYDGPAPISTYMEVKEGEGYQTTFRGREMHGTMVRVGPGYTGLVVKEGGGGVRVFGGMRVWGSDRAVDGGRDEYVRSVGEWTGLADQVGVSWEDGLPTLMREDASGRGVVCWINRGIEA